MFEIERERKGFADSSGNIEIGVCGGSCSCDWLYEACRTYANLRSVVLNPKLDSCVWYLNDLVFSIAFLKKLESKI